ncbi:hypothetical protein AAVH_11478 [Aphelenchoides avenae]|nr:hypothetical protein AAVH_11478 [Aphelenchus avenae]
MFLWRCFSGRLRRRLDYTTFHRNYHSAMLRADNAAEFLRITLGLNATELVETYREEPGHVRDMMMGIVRFLNMATELWEDDMEIRGITEDAATDISYPPNGNSIVDEAHRRCGIVLSYPELPCLHLASLNDDFFDAHIPFELIKTSFCIAFHDHIRQMYARVDGNEDHLAVE